MYQRQLNTQNHLISNPEFLCIIEAFYAIKKKIRMNFVPALFSGKNLESSVGEPGAETFYMEPVKEYREPEPLNLI